jgi:hypothetical protein
MDAADRSQDMVVRQKRTLKTLESNKQLQNVQTQQFKLDIPRIIHKQSSLQAVGEYM